MSNYRGKKRSAAKRVLVIGLLVILIFCAVSMAGSAIVFHTLFRRPPADPALPAAVTADALPVSFPSGGNELRGALYGAGNNKGLIIIAHGFRGRGGTHLPEALYFADAGWTVLLFDGTGSGDSDGDSVIGLSQMRRDLLAAMDFVSADPELSALPLFLYGHSAGAYAAATLCGDARVSAVVCLSGFDSPTQLMLYHARDRIGPLADVEYPFMLAWDWMTAGPDSGLSAAECLLNADRPALVVQGTEDDIVPYELSLFAVCEEDPPGGVTLVLLDQRAHSTAWLAEDPAFLEEISDFYLAALPAA